ncbi:hypothetical protein GOBAR_AA11091 [Gossypium barbadense]|uniref:RRM domain-containing protein n=1 Tax=Gossypium barbadense TaxID=3634 RepID=A0A2P5Y1S8_GOSBA|nr:hypothetical protein GOBAR_AA11091 [Gossypium barbadense]
MRGSYITVFVFNIPMTMHWKGLWTLFSYHRKVVDAFIPEKTSKSRKRFGFIRFSNFLDAKRAITRLNDKSGRWEKRKSGRGTYDVEMPNRFESDGSGRGDKSIGNLVQGHVENEQLWKLQKCLVREVVSFCEVKNLADRVVGMSLDEISVKRIQGNHFLIEIPDDELYDILKQRDWSYLKEFFIHIAPWSKKLMFSNGLKIARKWGTLVSMAENWSGANNFEKVEMMISISQKVLEELNEGDNVVASLEMLEDVDARASRLNRGLDPASEDVFNMGLALEIGPSGEQGGVVDSDKELGFIKSEGWDFSQEVEEEFSNVIRSRRKKKQFNKRISSMRKIQDRVLSSKEKQKRDQSKRKGKSNEELRREDKVMNLSLSDSDISNRRKVILRKAKQTWEIGKKLGLSVRGDERDLIEDIMRLEEQQ